MKKIRLFFDQKLLGSESEHVVFLDPLLGSSARHIWGYDEEEVKKWEEAGKEYMEFANISECDYVVYPKYFSLNFLNELKKVTSDARKHNKKVLVFYTSDIEEPLNIENTLIFRRSINTKNPKNEFSLPAFPGDLLQKYYNGQLKLDGELAIGYTGYSDYYDLRSFFFYLGLSFARLITNLTPIKKLIFNRNDEKLFHLLIPLGIGKYARGKAIRYLRRNSVLKFNCIERKGGLYIKTEGKLREEYLENINNNIFSLVSRGNGNYSFRLYEVMSLGKIPIFIDTDSKLPLDNIIPYKELFVWIAFEDLWNAEKYIHNYLEKNKGKLAEIQIEIRRIYKEYLSLNNYFKFVIDNIL